MRVNEVKQLKIKDINTIYEKEELIIVTHKTRKERKLFFSKEAIKQIKKHFVFNDNSKDEDFIIIRFISLLFYFITPKGLRNFVVFTF
jgi:site-specific recombinase XerD